MLFIKDSKQTLISSKGVLYYLNYSPHLHRRTIIKTIITSTITFAVMGTALASSFVRSGSQEAYEMMRRSNDRANQVRQEVALFEKQKKEELKDAEKKEKELRKEYADLYYREAEDRIKTIVFEPDMTLQECIEKIGMRVIEADSLTDAGFLAKTQASIERSYIVKQIESSGELAQYKISTSFPYYISDTRYKNLKKIKLYDKTFITQFTRYGIATKRTYKFISASKGTTNTKLKFEEGEIIFITKGLDLNTKINQLNCVTLTGNVSAERVKEVITDHNKKITPSSSSTKAKAKSTSTKK